MSLEPRTPAILRFGSFEVEVRTGELRKQGVRIKLQEQPFHVLTLLLQRPGDVVTRGELRAQVWPEDTFVDFDNSLNTAINKLREALGDSADNPRFIETLPRRGYRFIAPVRNDHQRKSLPARIRWKIAVPIALVAFVAATVAGGLLWRTRQVRRLTEKDTIVLADFTNTTGDPVFDDTLKQGLRVQLEQSPFLNILSDEKVGQELQLMGRQKDERLTKDLVLDLCQRVGSKAFLAGSISSLGTHYVIGLNALSCYTGETLAGEQVEADSREHVLKALGESVTRLRAKLGESLASIRKYDVPLEQATTPSLEALKAYSLGTKTFRTKGSNSAVPFFKRAVELDPKFATAYALLGVMYENLNEVELAIENVRKAYELRERGSEHERLHIQCHYYDIVTGDLEKATQAYEVWEQTYPRDAEPHDNLGIEYAFMGKYEQALAEAHKAVILEPISEDHHVTLALAYIYLNRLAEADTVLKQAEERKLEGEDLLSTRFLIAFLRGDKGEMDRLAATSAAMMGAAGPVLWEEELAEAYHGRLRKARQTLHLALNSSGNSGSFTAAANDQASLGLMEAYVGESQQATADANEALKRSPNELSTQEIAVLALAMAGDATGAKRVAEKLNRKRPLDTVVQRYLLPMSRAATALHNKNVDKALELLSGMTPYELSGGMIPGQSGLNLDQVYIHGLAFLMQGNGSAAAAEFQKIIDHPGIVQEDVVGALARLGLARAYALQRDTAKTRAAYEDFLSLWKDADPDIAILKEAKAEYAKLN